MKVVIFQTLLLGSFKSPKHRNLQAMGFIWRLKLILSSSGPSIIYGLQTLLTLILTPTAEDGQTHRVDAASSHSGSTMKHKEIQKKHGRLQPQTTTKAPSGGTWGSSSCLWTTRRHRRPHGARPAMFWTRFRNRSSSAWLSLNGEITKVQISKAWFPLQLPKIKPWEAFKNQVERSTEDAYHKKSSSGTTNPHDDSRVLQDSAVFKLASSCWGSSAVAWGERLKTPSGLNKLCGSETPDKRASNLWLLGSTPRTVFAGFQYFSMNPPPHTHTQTPPPTPFWHVKPSPAARGTVGVSERRGQQGLLQSLEVMRPVNLRERWSLSPLQPWLDPRVQIESRRVWSSFSGLLLFNCDLQECVRYGNLSRNSRYGLSKSTWWSRPLHPVGRNHL